jgi:hypothetical protein
LYNEQRSTSLAGAIWIAWNVAAIIDHLMQDFAGASYPIAEDSSVGKILHTTAALHAEVTSVLVA